MKPKRLSATDEQNLRKLFTPHDNATWYTDAETGKQSLCGCKADAIRLDLADADREYFDSLCPAAREYLRMVDK